MSYSMQYCCFSVLVDLTAVGLWVFEYYTKLQYNVLTKEDQANKWSSEGMADFGRSFWWILHNIYFFTTIN